MGTRVFLGKPPAGIEAWIKAHMSPTAPDGKVLYKTTASGEWLEDDADISDGTFISFANRDSAVEVIIPSKDSSGNDVTSIGYSVFSGCSGLTRVMIPNSVTSIGEFAFTSCSVLTSVTIPDSVTSIGMEAFSYCSSLTSVMIPNSVTSIEDQTFTGCSGLTSVTIGNGVMSIGNNVFGDCTSLTSVMIGNSVTSIGMMAFASCTSLTSVTIPNSVTSISQWVFFNCGGITSVTFNSFTKNEVKSMITSDYLFGTAFYDDNWNPVEKSFTTVCTDGSMTVHFSANDPATITFTDL